MARTAEEVTLALGVDNATFERELARAVTLYTQKLAQMDQRSEMTESRLLGWGKSLAAGLAAGFSVDFIKRFVQESVSALAQIEVQARRSGLSIRDTQALTYAAIKANVPTQDVAVAFEMLNRRVGEAAARGGELAKLFKENGIEIKDQNGNLRGTREIFDDIANLVKNARSEQDKQLIVFTAMGLQGRQFLPLFREGAQGIREMSDEAERVRFIVGDDMVKAAHEMEDGFSIAWQVFKVQAETATFSALKSIVDMANKGADAVVDAFKHIGRDLGITGALDSNAPKEIARNPFDTQRGSGKFTVIPHTLTEEEREAERDRKRVEDERIKNAQQLAAGINIINLAVRHEIDLLRLEAESQGKTTYEIERKKKELEIIAQLEAQHRQHGGAITPKEVQDAKDAAAAYGRASQALADNAEQLKQLKDVGDVVFNDMESALDKFIDTGKLSFRDFVESVVKDMAKLSVHNLLQQTWTGTPGQGGGLMNFLSQALGIGTNQPIGVLPSSISLNPYEQSDPSGALFNRLARQYPKVGASGPEDVIKQLPLGAVAVGSSGPTAQWGPYTGDIRAAASKYNLDPNVLAALINQESSFRPDALGDNGAAVGLTQLHAAAAQQVGVTDRWDPTQSIYGGAQYLSQQYSKFGDIRTALAAYNQGPGFVQNYGVNAAGGKYADAIIAQSQKYAGAVTTAAQNATQAATTSNVIPDSISKIAQSLSGMGGGAGGAGAGAGGGIGGILGLIFGGGAPPGQGTRAAGGDMEAYHAYGVGEHGPETIISNKRGRILPYRPPGSFGSGGVQGIKIEAYATEDLHLRIVDHASRLARQGDSDTLKIARSNLPEIQHRYQSLGTTT
jgi:hypothetical protein